MVFLSFCPKWISAASYIWPEHPGELKICCFSVHKVLFSNTRIYLSSYQRNITDLPRWPITCSICWFVTSTLKSSRLRANKVLLECSAIKNIFSILSICLFTISSVLASISLKKYPLVKGFFLQDSDKTIEIGYLVGC